MSNTHNLKGWQLKVLAVAILSTATPSVSQAQNADARGLWMATSANEALLSGRGFGRLAIADGMLVYSSPGFAWRVPLTEIKRVAGSSQVDNALEVESASGQVYFVAILNGQLTSSSPGKAVQAIQRAVRTALATAPAARTVLTAAGGSEH